jgi:hypothetical protein
LARWNVLAALRNALPLIGCATEVEVQQMVEQLHDFGDMLELRRAEV